MNPIKYTSNQLIKLNLLFLLLLTTTQKNIQAQSCDEFVIPPAIVNGITVTATFTGDVDLYLGPWTSCGNITTPANSIYLGQNEPFTYTMNFSESVNQIIIVITATGSDSNENFVFTTDGGIPNISSSINCYTTINGNEILSGLGSPYPYAGGGIFIITAPTPFTSITISGDGGYGGSILSVCSNSIIPFCLTGTEAPVLSSTSITNTNCILNTVNLTSITSSNLPNGCSLTWHTATPANNNNLITGTSVTSGTYYAAFYDSVNDCYSLNSTPVIVTINQAPIINAGLDQIICLGDQITLTATGANFYFWDNDATQGNPFTPTTTTIYTVIGTDLNGCSNTDELSVIVNPSPTASFIVNPNQITSLYPNSTMTNLSTGATSYLWDFGDQTANSSEYSPTHTFLIDDLESYQITLIATNDYECTDTSRATLQLIENLLYYIPNSFTPDGNELNPTFKPVFTSGFDPFNYTLSIYDRWGKLLFESHNSEIGWDGTYGGKIVQDGIYTWKIAFRTKNESDIKILTGNLNLMR